MSLRWSVHWKHGAYCSRCVLGYRHVSHIIVKEKPLFFHECSLLHFPHASCIDGDMY